MELYFLGPGIPLYFGFLKACLALLIVVGLTFSIFGMISNSKGTYCSTESAESNLC